MSVVVPTYNRAGHLPEALRAILGQRFADLELLVIDDGSTDDTPELVAAIDDPRIRYRRQQNAGASAARNLGLLLARGEYVSLVDSDDLVREEHLEQLVAVLDAAPDVGLVFADMRKFGHVPEGPEAAVSFLAPRDVGAIPHEVRSGGHRVFTESLVPRIVRGSFLPTSTLLFRRASLARCGLFDPSFRVCNDAEFLIRFCRLERVGMVERVLVDYRVHDDQLTSSKHKRLRLETGLRLCQRVAVDEPRPTQATQTSLRERRARCLHGLSRLARAERRSCEAVWRAGQLLAIRGFRVAGLRLAIAALLPSRGEPEGRGQAT